MKSQKQEDIKPNNRNQYNVTLRTKLRECECIASNKAHKMAILNGCLCEHSTMVSVRREGACAFISAAASPSVLELPNCVATPTMLSSEPLND
jgi:hypothetical protein